MIGPRQARVFAILADHPAGLAAALLLSRAGSLGFAGLSKMAAAGLIEIEPRRTLRQLAGALVWLRPAGIVHTIAGPDVEA